MGADVEGTFADDVVAGLKCGGAVAGPGDAAAIDAGLDRRAALEGCVGEVAGRIAVQAVTAGIVVAVGVLDVAGVVLRRRRIDIDSALLAVGPGDVDAGGIFSVDPRDRRRPVCVHGAVSGGRSEEHTSELQSLMRISYAVFCLNKKNKN